ncbi:hypothetical protein [Streptomyces sp. NRRL F-5126]|uniref:hypothetical protein n=1 Tax=Streptomyces sp. NRRL F-5126 TaxID=1463857 RepID=UPI000B2496EC|nr:hypothetical protein [Streptomyces sp. NRRL F-5126]
MPGAARPSGTADTRSALRSVGAAAPAGIAIAADGSYAARLAPVAPAGPGAGAAVWFPERWTLAGPEPYAVPLPLGQPEEPDSQVQPLSDGRVLISRRVADSYVFSLLYPTGPGTGEVPLGAVECERLTLLPPAPGGSRAYALVPGARTTDVWLVAGGAFGPELVTRVPGHCTGGAWLDRTGRLLALDREAGGVVKTVAVDLERGGEMSPLLQIAEDSDDRLLLADPDSGLLLIRSNAPGEDRIGWGVLGSTRPVRFPECLRPADGREPAPFAAQPGLVLTPETCAVAFRVDGVAGGTCVGVWRPAGRRLHLLPAPPGWLAGAGLWTREGVLRLPCTTAGAPCAVAEVRAPDDATIAAASHRPGRDRATGAARTTAERGGAGGVSGSSRTQSPQPEPPVAEPRADVHAPVVCRPVPLQQAPLQQRAGAGRVPVGGQGVLG